MDSSAEIADPFAMNHPNLENPFLPARRQVCRQELFDIARVESVQIQLPFNRDLNRLSRRILKSVGLHHCSNDYLLFLVSAFKFQI